MKTLCEQCESMLAPMSEVCKSYSLHLASHSHIDLNFLLGYDKTVVLENELVKASFTPMTFAIVSLVDKSSGLYQFITLECGFAESTIMEYHLTRAIISSCTRWIVFF